MHFHVYNFITHIYGKLPPF